MKYYYQPSRTPAQITKAIKKCSCFEGLKNILYSPDWKNFNAINVATAMHHWSLLWKKAKLQANEQEIKSMTEHLEKETFSALIEKANNFINDFNPREFANIANALSHLSTSKERQDFLHTIFTHIQRQELSNYNPQELANLANALAKVLPESTIRHQLLARIATHIQKQELNNYKPQNLANLANAVAKILPEATISQQLMAKMATHIQTQPLSNYNPQELSNLANAVTKILPESDISQKLMDKIATHIQSQHISNYNPQSLANLANALAKVLPDSTISQQLMTKIATHIQSQQLSNYNPQNLANLANAVAKILPESSTSQLLMAKIATYIQSQQLSNYNPQNLANLANALAKALPESDISQALMAKMTTHIQSQPLSNYKPQELANIAHATAVLGHLDEKSFQKLNSAIITLNLNQLALEEVQQIYQFYLFAHYKGIDISLNTAHLQQYRNKLTQQPVRVSTLENNVSKTLQELLKTHTNSLQLMDSYPAVGSTVDIAILSKITLKSKIAIEVDGPTHYQQQGQNLKLNHSSRFKTMLLEAEGWTVLRLPYFELDKVKNNPQAFQKYLSGKINPILDHIEPETKGVQEVQILSAQPNNQPPKPFAFSVNAQTFIPSGQAVLPVSNIRQTAGSISLRIKPYA
jgi:very-short-patch-repair endonuclease